MIAELTPDLKGLDTPTLIARCEELWGQYTASLIKANIDNGMKAVDAVRAETRITYDNIDRLLDQGRLQVAMQNGRWWDIRRNGATRRWKRDAIRIYIPYKYGLKFYGVIDQNDFVDGVIRPNYYRIKTG